MKIKRRTAGRYVRIDERVLRPRVGAFIGVCARGPSMEDADAYRPATMTFSIQAGARVVVEAEVRARGVGVGVAGAGVGVLRAVLLDDCARRLVRKQNAPTRRSDLWTLLSSRSRHEFR